MEKYYDMFKCAFMNQLEYRVNFISSFLFSLFTFSVNTLLWLAVVKNTNTVPLEVTGIISYYFITLIVSNMTSTISIYKISDEIRLGNLNKHLLKPYNYALYQLMLDLPKRIIFIFMNSLPLALIYFLLKDKMSLKLSGIKILFFLLFLMFGYLINFLIDFLIALYSFYFSRVTSLYTSINVFRNISAGVIFPLVVLPKSFFNILKNMPFMYTNYVPTMLLIEEFDTGEIFRNFLKSFSWFLLLWIICIITWKKGLKKYSSYGG
ncbi:ABC transporter permease [Fusobacterium necrophorum]|uniref:ABC transporter permease n=2 Tax=Fusobacterium necrophorum TaxID=859 RepID=A0AB73BXY2_9FUSO|nr:ABC-2 family transporter protein [Fusobacterium necrophorum]AYZ74468.1 ABC transporter permease [Fusobacterium necrophorum]AZW09647.1 ABC transporter permease [Fusobacterium necrophorum subsp. necrophorum]KDE61499.1 ABC transporter permease [Fusobacterium necrophorum DJ-1]KDE63046.1 ABC transporter permease [Fusobacterium necrophorum BFTR-1]KDE64537.1 ABC transporter permease [Fusobacterium necrophorum BL]